MSRKRDSTSPSRRALLQPPSQKFAIASQDKSCKNTASMKDEKTPLLNSIGEATESLVNNSVVGGGDIQTGISWGMAAFLLVNTALGAGMLNYPYAYNQIGGVFAAALTQIVLLIFISSTMFILVYCADFNRDNTYHDVLLSMCGKQAQQISALSIMLTCFGINITFLVIIGDQYDRIFHSLLEPNFLETYWFLDRKFTIFLTAVLFIWPMCYAQRLDFLRHASILGMFAMLYVAFLTVYEHFVLDQATIDATMQMHLVKASGPMTAITNNKTQSSVQSTAEDVKSLKWFEPLAIVPVLCFAYQTHEVIVPVYACMTERFIGKFMKASIFGLIILFFLYNLVGAFGYLTFGENVGADIMSLYDAKDPVVVVGIVALVIKFITTYPPLMFCGRSALDGLYAEFRKLSTNEFRSHERARRYVISTLWFLTTVALAVFAPDISVTLQLLGSMASINVFVFPGMCLFSLTRRLRRARLALLLGELPDGSDQSQTQRAKDFYLISGTYFGAAMRNKYQQQQQYHHHHHHHHNQNMCCASQIDSQQQSDINGTSSVPTNPKLFSATFASLLDFENNATNNHSNINATGSMGAANLLNGGVSSSGCGTGEILSSISTPSTSSSATSCSSSRAITTSLSAHDQRQSTGSIIMINGCEPPISVQPKNALMSLSEQREQQQIRQIQNRQDKFERLVLNGNSCCCSNINTNSMNKYHHEYRQQSSTNYHHSYSSCGGAGGSIGGLGGGKTINDSYDDYSDCLDSGCLNQHLHPHKCKHGDKITNTLLTSHKQSQQSCAFNARAHETDINKSSSNLLQSATGNQLNSNLTTTKYQNTTGTQPCQLDINHCQHCHQYSCNYKQQPSLSLQNSLNYATYQQSTTGSLLDKLGTSIAPSTVAQIGISRCTATGLYSFAIFLILFGIFIFFLELVSVLGFL